MIGSYHYSPDIWPLLLCAAIALGLAIYAWRQRAVAGAIPFAICQLLLAAADIANALQVASDGLPLMVFWFQMWTLFISTVPVASLAFAGEYARVTHRLTRPIWAILLGSVFIGQVLTVTNDAHHLIWARLWLDQGLQVEYGIVGQICIAYAYGVRLVTLLIFASHFIHVRGFYRVQTGLMIVAGMIAWGGMALRFIGMDIPWRIEPSVLDISWRIEPSVLGTTVGNLIFAWALFRYRVFDVRPIARDTVIEHMGDGVIVLDTQNRLLDLNPAARRLLGTKTKAMGQDAVAVLGHWQELGQLIGEPQADEPSRVLKRTGKWYHTRTLPLTDSRDMPIGRLIILQDTTLLHQAQTNAIQQARTVAILEERERLARELHDSLGQVLGFVKMQAQAARNLLSQDNHKDVDAYLAQLVAVTQDAHADVRDYILNFQTDHLAHGDLIATLRQYVDRLNEMHPVQTTLTVSPALDEKSLDPTVEVQLLRIVQEALTNIRKHACAHNAHLYFEADDTQLQVTVEDDGVGFDPAEVHPESRMGYGLRAMQDRARGIGGRVEFDSAPGQGTRVRVFVPLKKRVTEEKDYARFAGG